MRGEGREGSREEEGRGEERGRIKTKIHKTPVSWSKAEKPARPESQTCDTVHCQ